MAQSEARRRLANLMEKRRLELDLTWDQVAARGGVSLRALATARKEDREIRALTRTNIERGLDWELGSIERILAGGDPAPAGDEPPARPVRIPGPGAGQHPARPVNSILLPLVTSPELRGDLEPIIDNIVDRVMAVKAGEPVTGSAVFPGRGEDGLAALWDKYARETTATGEPWSFYDVAAAIALVQSRTSRARQGAEQARAG